MEKEFKILLDIMYDLAKDRPDIQDRLEDMAVIMNEGQVFKPYPSVSGSYGVPKNPKTTETGRKFWLDCKNNKVFMEDVDGKVFDITKK